MVLVSIVGGDMGWCAVDLLNIVTGSWLVLNSLFNKDVDGIDVPPSVSYGSAAVCLFVVVPKRSTSCGREVFGIALCCVIALVPIPFVRKMTCCVFRGVVVLVVVCATSVVARWCRVCGVGHLTGCGGIC